MAIQRITSGIIADGAIVATDIGDNTVTTSKIADANVTSSKLASSLTISANTGSASAPSIYPNDDTNTGIFFPAADTIAFAEGGAEAMRIDSSKNLLLGTTSHETGAFGSAIGMNINSTRPQMLLRNSATAETGYMGIAGNILYVATANSIPLAFVTSDVERARITAGGYFKASDNGTYDDATGAYHEFRQSADAITTRLAATNASYSSALIQETCNRSASDQYQFLRCYSNAGTDTEILLRGDGNGYADGAFNNNGADYAEFFESANGQALTLGATVVLDGNKVREATDEDPTSAVIGVVRPKEPSKASMIIGNTAWNKWANKYLSDDFDRYIMEDHDVVEWTDEEGKFHSYESHNIPEGITVPEDATVKTHDENNNKFQHYKLNPEWDKDSEYVNRENRPEWNIIGLLGQVKILKGQPVGDRWIKMRDVSETVEEWFIR
jgi:hypothetical protein